MPSPRAHSTDGSRPGPLIPELTLCDFAQSSNANFLPQCRVRQGCQRAIRVQEAPPAASAPFVQRLDPSNPPASKNAVKILQSFFLRYSVARHVTRPSCPEPETLDVSGPPADASCLPPPHSRPSENVASLRSGRRHLDLSLEAYTFSQFTRSRPLTVYLSITSSQS
jgi:hypothetical protein